MMRTEAKNQQKKENVTVNREHKDRLFKIIFQEKSDLLCLYNAINGTTYDNPDDLTITTMEDVIYISMKNDVSFILDDQISLYEHQSTVSGNLPIRGVFYLSRQYETYVQQLELNLFSTAVQKLPFPQFFVFYNGTTSMPDRVELKLSDAFIRNEHTRNLTPALECTATLLNINEGHNLELMNNCRALREYAQFIKILRENLDNGIDKEQAILDTINYCMEHDILKQRLIKEKGKVVDVLLTECDWDYVKKLYDKDFGRMLKEIERIESEKEQAVEQARTEKEQAVEQARTEKEQAIARNQQLLYTLLETYKETGLAKEQAVDLLTQKIPDISLELAEETAEQIFKN